MMSLFLVKVSWTLTVSVWGWPKVGPEAPSTLGLNRPKVGADTSDWTSNWSLIWVLSGENFNTQKHLFLFSPLGSEFFTKLWCFCVLTDSQTLGSPLSWQPYPTPNLRLPTMPVCEYRECNFVPMVYMYTCTFLSICFLLFFSHNFEAWDWKSHVQWSQTGLEYSPQNLPNVKSVFL